ncbi:MAG: methionyl-tRNA formyltransferase [Zoogloeaceae bacterium]|jgi:methionyl-tRNA formyltransferase|nr:methionyl-tRNA formyltransferase [Zoogloeaceae bacterium]
MKLLFAGTPEFAATALAALLAAGHEIPLSLTQPDRPAGRGMRLQASPVKVLSIRNNLPVSQPLSLRNAPDLAAELASFGAEAMIVAAYGLILPPEILALFPLGCINIHASLLPRWRGAAPIQRAILAGDTETGISIMRMEAGLDTGPVLAQRRIAIAADETAASLHDRLAALGAALLLETLPRLAEAGAVQPETGATYAARIDKAEAKIDWRADARELERKIRAFNPFPAAQTRLDGAPLKIWRARVFPEATGSQTPGMVLASRETGLLVACGTGALLLEELQGAGGKRLAAPDFLRGHTIAPGKILG